MRCSPLRNLALPLPYLTPLKTASRCRCSTVLCHPSKGIAIASPHQELLCCAFASCRPNSLGVALALRHDSSPCETLPLLCFAVLHPALPLQCSVPLYLAVASPGNALPNFAFALLCATLPYFTAAMPCFALMRLDLPCSYKARLSYREPYRCSALRDYTIAVPQ